MSPCEWSPATTGGTAQTNVPRSWTIDCWRCAEHSLWKSFSWAVLSALTKCCWRMWRLSFDPDHREKPYIRSRSFNFVWQQVHLFHLAWRDRGMCCASLTVKKGGRKYLSDMLLLYAVFNKKSKHSQTMVLAWYQYSSTLLSLYSAGLQFEARSLAEGEKCESCMFKVN